MHRKASTSGDSGVQVNIRSWERDDTPSGGAMDGYTLETSPGEAKETDSTSPSEVNSGYNYGRRNSTLSVMSLRRTSTDESKSRFARRLSTFRTNLSQQSFTDQQRKTLNTFSSVSYTPTHSVAYINWIGERKSRLYHRLEWDRWFLVFMIGVSIGLVAALLKQSIQALRNFQWRITTNYLKHGNISQAFWFETGLNCLYVLVGSFLVTFVHPPAVGGGTPEVLAFLNGIIVHGTLSLKNLIVKFIANVFAVASGLPAAIQAPIITYGAIIGTGIGQFQSKSLGFSPNMFTRFRNAEDKRQFTTNGVAAGVSAGFNSPIGGLLFAMEDLSSFWSKGLSWQTFFCCVVSTAVAQMLNTAFTGFVYRGTFGAFNVNLVEPVQMSVVMLIPAMLLGLVGGVLGAFFSRLNVFFSQLRRRVFAKVSNQMVQKCLRILEPVLVSVAMTSYTIFLPFGFNCQKVQHDYIYSEYSSCAFTSANISRPFSLNTFNCPSATNDSASYYNPMSTLIQGSGTSYLEKLWSRDTYFMFDYDVCLSAFVVYFLATIYTAGTAIAGGIFVPLLVSGSLYGRAMGVGMIYIWGAITGTSEPTNQWRWLDPGVMAAVGSASLLSGVNRLAVASTVIVMEMAGDIALVIPIFCSIFISKMVADQLSKPLYKVTLDTKALPYLEQNPHVVVKGKSLNMEMSRASDVMSCPVETIHCKEIVANLACLLLNTSHSAFPVVKFDTETKKELAYGLITRTELYVILCSKDVYDRELPGVLTPRISAEDLSVDYITDKSVAEERIRTYAKFDIYSNIYVDLDPYINMSMPKIDHDYSLYRTYLLFRTLGLRHLVVIDTHNHVVGMITRKDLMQFNMEEKLTKLLERSGLDGNHDDVITPPVFLPSLSFSPPRTSSPGNSPPAQKSNGYTTKSAGASNGPVTNLTFSPSRSRSFSDLDDTPTTSAATAVPTDYPSVTTVQDCDDQNGGSTLDDSTAGDQTMLTTSGDDVTKLTMEGIVNEAF